MVNEIQNAINSKRVLLIRINETPDGNFITVEPHLIIHNILYNQMKCLFFITEHWAEGGLTGWVEISVESVIEIQETDFVFVDRNPKPVDWQLNNQLFPPVQ